MLALSSLSRRMIYSGLLLLLLIRVIAQFIIPLTDDTEARYAEISRKMLETGNWVTPLHDYGVPFWAKPPLSTWLSAGSMGLFGVNEFAVRLPAMLLTLGILGLVYWHVRQRRNQPQALLSVAVLASSALVYIVAGTVMTDPALVIATTLTMVTFWQAMEKDSRMAGYLFFVSLGIGMLAKGPVAIVLAAMPIGLWALYHGKLMEVWRRLPWITGAILVFVIAAPWYYLAEQRTPGFFDYFFVGEHFKRFTQSGWQGDRYGNAHAEPLGMIWVYWLEDSFPWSPLVIAGLMLKNYRPKTWLRDSDGWTSYLLLWSLCPLIFFSIAHNVIQTYVLPAMPAFAILFIEVWQRGRQAKTDFPIAWLTAGLLIPAAILTTAVLIAYFPSEAPKQSEKALVETYTNARESADSKLVYYSARAFSAEFYSAGKVRAVNSDQGVLDLLDNCTRDFFAIRIDHVASLPESIKTRFSSVKKFGTKELFEENPPIKQCDHTPVDSLPAPAPEPVENGAAPGS